jgi:hypothetical protein
MMMMMMNQGIKQALHHKKKSQSQWEKPTSVAMLPYQQTISNKISRLLAKGKLSCYMPWRHLGGEEVQLLLILDLGTRWG